jgi:tRNA threonylcarbamoyladenosine biosynthesis protein TsaB
MSASLLAIDTATEALCIALVSGDRTHTHESEGGARASVALIPAALELLASAGVALRELDAIAFGRGPGAFTGLRTACAVAQGFALGAGLPVLALDSLALVAEDARAQQQAGDDVWVAMDARMQEVYAAHYRHDGRGWQVVSAPALYTLDALAAQWRAAPPRVVAGSALEVHADAHSLAGGARLITRQRARSQALAALALAAWHDGPRLDAAEAWPLYLRDKVALTTAEREARQPWPVAPGAAR